MIKFDLPKTNPNIIKVLGVGGGGSNAVNHMFNQGIRGVDFVICNTDAQALTMSPIPIKIQLGSSLTEGRGAGSIPEIGRKSAIENIEDINHILDPNTKMLFITAGMGGGTGTGAAPVIAAEARKLDILTVGIVTIPFSFEGRKRKQQADQGINELREHVDTLLIVSNDKLRELYGDLPLSQAFHKADDILTTAAKGIAEIITVAGYINVDFEDVKTVMKNSGVAIMGSGMASGEDRAVIAVEEALSSPLLNDNNINGACNILLYISSGSKEVSMDEVTLITDFIQEKAGSNAEIIWGNGKDDSLGENISITIVATGFQPASAQKQPEKKNVVGTLGDPIMSFRPEPVLPYTPPTIEAVLNEITLISKNPEPEAEVTPEAPIDLTNTGPIIYDLYGSSEPDDEYYDDEENEEEPAMSASEEPVNTQQNDVPVWREAEPLTSPNPRPVQAKASPEYPNNKNSFDRNSQERINKLRELSLQLKKPDEIERMEKEPAFRRREVELSDTVHSSESQVSRLSLADDSKNGVELRQNNAYLHDNVD